MSNIRLTYAGLIGLVVRLSSLVTGLVFSVLVTRNLVVEDFGLYSLIGSLIAYALFGHLISGYWVRRQIPRGENVGKAAIIWGGIFSIVGIIVYLTAAYLTSQNTSSDFQILALASILIPATYLANTIDTINYGFKPQANSYSILSFEVAKIPLGYILLEPMGLGLVGAIIATFIALLVKILTGVYFAFPKLKEALNLSYIKKWIKLSWLPLYGGFAGNIFVLDTAIVAILLGSTEPLAFFAVAITIASIVGHSQAITSPLEPKLIADARKDYVKTTTRLFTLFGIPLFVAIIVFAKPLLFLLNPVYSTAIWIVYILGIRTFIISIQNLLGNVITGIERVDTNDKATFTQYRKSNLFLTNTLSWIRTGLYLVPIIAVFSLITTSNYSLIDLVIIWAIIALISDLAITIVYALLVKKVNYLLFDWKSILKYFLLSVIAGSASYYFVENFIVFERDLQVFLPGLAAALAIGAAIYIGTLYFLDDYLRLLIRAIFKKDKKM